MFKLLTKRKGEKGQALILVLLMVTVGSLIIVSLLGFIGTGSKSEAVSLKKTNELYAADAGIQDAVWQIKYDHILNFTSPSAYSPYDFSTVWTDPSVTTVNGQNVTATIQNDWVVSNFTAPDVTTATSIIDGAQLVVSGSTVQTGIIDGTNTISKYDIKINYYPISGQTMLVSSIGVWLPPGYSYFADSTYKSSFEGFSGAYQASPVTSNYQGNTATIWSFSNPAFASFPNIDGTNPIVMDAYFYFKPPSTQTSAQPQAVSWIIPSGLTGIPVSWDADTRIFKINSTAGSTAIESYIGKTQVRQMAAAIGGDYYATGNSNLSASSGSLYRTIAHDPSSATVANTNIPTNAQVTGAFLYWSAWRSSNGTSLFSDSATNFSNWTNGSAWSLGGSSFQGHYDASHTGTTLTKNSVLNLTSYKTPTSPLVLLSWNQWVTQGSGSTNQTQTPDWDDSTDSTGTWTSTGANRFSQVNDSNTSTYITQTGAGTGAAYFGFTPSFSVPTGSTISDVTINYTAKAGTITYAGAGTTMTAASGNVTPTLPVNWQANDIFICVVSSHDNKAATMPAGWTAWEPGKANGTTLQFSVFWKRATSSESNPTVTHSTGSYIDAVIVAYRGCITTGDPADISGPTVSTTPANVNLNFSTAGITTIINNDMVVEIGSPRINTTAATYTGSPTPTERVDGPTAANYHQLIVADFPMATAGSTLARKSTLAASAINCGKLIALKPATGNVHSGLKVGSTVYNSTDPGSTPGSSFANYSYVYANNPATSAAWQITDVNALQFFGVNAAYNMIVSDVSIIVDYSTPVSSADGLDFYIYDGTNWNGPLQAFRGNIGSTADNFSYPVPAQYLTANFNIRFVVVGFSGSGNYANIDNISIATMAPDTDVIFKIDNNQGGGAQQVYLDSNSNPQKGSQKLNATKSQVVQNLANQVPPTGYAYESYCDVTKLVQAYSQPPVSPATNYPGYGIYWVGDISVDSSSSQVAFATWSIVLVYQSPDTLGHQLYLYDTFTGSGQNTLVSTINVTNGGTNYTSAPTVNISGNGNGAQATATVSGGRVTSVTVTNGGSNYTTAPTISFSGGGGSSATATAVITPVDVDFDHDGHPGGTISGFIVPPQITGAVTSISLTGHGSGYTSIPAVKFTGGGGTGAAAMAFISGGQVTSIMMTNDGSGYTSTPTVSFTGGGGSGAAATVTVGDEVNVGKITTYVGEGDMWFGGDYLMLNGTKLWEGTTTSYPDGYSPNNNENTKTDPDNAFNSTSYGINTNDGIDLDTFGIDPTANPAQYITWSSGLLNQGDTSAQIDLYTHTDTWFLGYVIISFRSVTTTGGSLSYLIQH